MSLSGAFDVVGLWGYMPRVGEVEMTEYDENDEDESMAYQEQQQEDFYREVIDQHFAPAISDVFGMDANGVNVTVCWWGCPSQDRRRLSDAASRTLEVRFTVTTTFAAI